MDEAEYYTKLYEEFEDESEELKSGEPHERTPQRDPSDVLTWSKFFMAVAFLSAQRSHDPNTQVGVCIVNPKKKIIAVGHNQLPLGCVEGVQLADFKFDWTNRNVKHGWDYTKYPYVCHAAINAILSKNAENLDGCTVYTTLFPGHEDAKMIIQSGIKKVVYYPSPDEVKKAYTKIAKDLLKRANVKFVSYLEPDRDPWEPTEPTVSKRTQTEETSYTVQEREKNDRRPIDPTLESSQTSSAVQQREQKDRRYLTSDFTLELNNEEACCCDANRDFFMAMAKLTSKRSKDPNRQVGACIVNSDGKIVGFGYNGFPYGIDDSTKSWGNLKTSRDPMDVKFPYEANAILHKTCIDLKDCTLYVTLFPCNECAKLIIQSGIKQVYYLEGGPQIPTIASGTGETVPPKKDKKYTIAYRRLLEMAGYSLLPVNCSDHERSKFCQRYVPSKDFEIRFPPEPKSKRNLLTDYEETKRTKPEDEEDDHCPATKKPKTSI